MFNFNLKTAPIFQAVKWAKHPAQNHTRFLESFFFVAFIIFFLLFLFGFLTNTLDKISLSRLLGPSILTLILTIFLKLLSSFFNLKLAKPGLDFNLKSVAKNPANFNLAGCLSFPSAKAVFESIKWSRSMKILEVDSGSLFYYLLKDNSELGFIFFRAGLDFNQIKKGLKENLREIAFRTSKSLAGTQSEYEPIFAENFQNSVLEALKIGSNKNHRRIEMGDIISGLAKFDPVFKKILIQNKLKAADIEKLTLWLESLKERIQAKKKWWEYKNLIKKGSLGREWAAGYTLTLDRYSIDWSRIMRERGFPETVGHLEETKIVERILSRREINNVLLVGEPGTGRKSIINAISSRSALGESLAEVNYKRIVELDLPLLVSQLENREEIEAVLNTIFQEVVSAGNIILVIDEFHDFVSGKERPGVVDISGIISSFLPFPQFQIIAVTTYQGLHQDIERRPTILSLFEKVEVPEISEEETLIILENLVPLIEKKYRIFIFFPAIRDIVSLSAKYLPALPFPKKAMDIFDEVAVQVCSLKRKVVTEQDVVKIISEKTQIPIGKMEVREREILLNLEQLIHQKIINQDLAVKEVSSALRRARAEVFERKKPMGTFLFLGPTGVGKTETAKALAEIYFGEVSKIIRLDMSEFQQIKDISRLIGSAKEDGYLTTKIREDPFSLVLLDEIEKAHPNILNLFLSVLDEGYLTDGLGRTVDFKNTIIIATSNAGYQIILEALARETEWSLVKKTLMDYLFEKGIFRPEFINRFDGVIVFNPLTKENLLDIVGLQLQKLKEGLLKKDIEFIITNPLKEKIVQLSYNPQFGAREMKRVIQDKIENVLAKALLGGEIKRGDRIEINPLTFQVVRV